MILPTPTPPFQWRQTSAGAALVCSPLEPFAPHFFTSRAWMLGARRPEITDRDAWAEVAAVIGSARGVTRLRQVHGRRVVIATPPDQPVAEGDILMTGDSSLAIAAQAADCVPLLLVDPAKGVVAAAHAGWRGMAAGVPGAAVAALGREYHCRTDDLLVAAGPSIGACCYEVGSDVREALVAAGWSSGDIEAWFLSAPISTAANPSMPLAPPRPGHWFFDGWACVRRQLVAAGVRPERIFSAGLCTASHPDCFPSYRRDGARAGRIVGVIRCGSGGSGGSGG